MDSYTLTKIVATIGPASATPEKIRELYDAGVTMFRINSSHETTEVHGRSVDIIREVEKEKNTLIPILLDLQGPKIRVGTLAQPIEIKKGDKLKFQHAAEMINNIVPVDYKGIAKDVNIGERILIDDGKIQFKVVDIDGAVITTEALTDGLLKQRKGINIPGSTGSINVLTARDLEFIDFAVEKGIDYIGLSFVREASDVIQLRELLNSKNSQAKIISKIEKPQAVVNIDRIIDVSDGIMVARGDLGIEISTEQVPLVQKTIIRKANIKRKVVIVATQMLESMIENPIPTRAETSDVANAIIDGTDAIMLSGETAAGHYPIESVKMMKQIAYTVEHSAFIKKNKYPKKMVIEEKNTQAMAIGMAIADMTNKMNIKAITALTGSGFTPIFMSKGRLSAPIIALCPDKNICRAIKLYRGVFPIPTNFNESMDRKSLADLERLLVKYGFKENDVTVITGSLPDIMVGGTNFIKIHKIGSAS